MIATVLMSFVVKDRKVETMFKVAFVLAALPFVAFVAYGIAVLAPVL